MNAGLALEKVPCSFCGTNDSRTWRTLNNWIVVECARCRFRFTNPRPAREHVSGLYASDYFLDARHRQSYYDADGTRLRTPPQGNYANRVLDIEPWFNVRGTLFEVGAANGAFLKIMQDRGWRVSGIDICPDAVRFGRATFNVDLVVGDAEYYDTSERFDAVCMYQTLEHMPNPLLALRKAHTWLRPGGVLVIEVPNADSFDIRISRRSEELILDLPRHMSHFTPRFLCHQLERLGFQTLQCHLYPAHVLLTVLSARRTTLNASNEATIAKGVHVLPQALPPLARLPAGTWKSRLLQMLASIAPGWRFTVIARTSPSR